MTGRVGAKWDPKTQRISCSIPVTWEGIAWLADVHYADGWSHKRVTAWLESEIKQGYRSHLKEVTLPDGTKRWVHPSQLREVPSE